ncbi:hypothetical protein [Neobacillus niacini]|uniref:hypothetical protein n=1 Tax=Neobacillus niacini TaxID=86668 RepID=UPI0021CB876B|nr:hypothetical protein [Neobacillus niacini]MCM3763444.1 hypothetical protein [Neobacillus niacini]
MADKNDVVIINLDRPRELRFGHRAMKKLLAITGKTIEEFNIEDFEFEDIEKVIWCGLLSDAKENNETLKLEDMEDLLDQAPYKEIMGKLGQAFNAAFGDDGTADEKNLQRVVEKSKKTKKK